MNDLQARTNAHANEPPNPFNTIGGLGFAVLPPAQWTSQMAAGAKAFAVGPLGSLP